MEPSVAIQPPPDVQGANLPAPARRIAMLALVALVSGIGLARLATRSHVESYPGLLTARIVPITADRAGVIVEWLVAEGDSIRLGQPLAAMADPSVDCRRQELSAEIARLEGELERAYAKADLELDWRMKEVNETIFTARLQAAEYLEERHLHEMEKVVLTDLLSHDSTAFWLQPDTVIDSLVLKDAGAPASRLNTVLRLEAATNAAEVCTAQVDLCDEQVDWLEELKGTLPERVRKAVGVDIAEHALEAAQHELEKIAAAESRTLISSTAIGRAGVFSKRVGDYAAVGEPIVEVLDDSQRYLVVDVPSEKVSEFTVGRELVVIFPGDVHRTGRVVRVAPQAVQRGAAATAMVVRVYVEQAGFVWPEVPIGARVDACL